MIDAYGWSVALQREFAPFAALGFLPARVTVQLRGAYVLAAEGGELTGRCAGKLRHSAAAVALPVAGDWVAISPRPAEGAATIHAVLPRRTMFARKAVGGQGGQVVAANIDVALLVTSMNAEFNARRLERYLALAWSSGARPVVVLTKADLAEDAGAMVAQAGAAALGVAVIAVSVVSGQGLAALGAHVRPGETCVLVGSSGVGKSSLVNALAGRGRMATGMIREEDARGRHTTTHRELVLLPGGVLLLDTPGMREVGLSDADDGVASVFEDVERLATACRFRDCAHDGEPGCAVRAALEAGRLDEARWRGFVKLRRELAYVARKEDRVAREAAHRRWIIVTKGARARQKLKGER